MDPQRSSDIDLLTLTIAAVASGVAAYVTSQVWAGGTLVSAALTPVIVALVKEGLNRPVDRVTNLRDRPTEAQSPASPLHPPVTVYGRSQRRWKVAIVSGLAAFLVVVAVFTVPELVAGKSIGRSGDSGTTLFGGKTRTRSKAARKRSSKKATPGSEATATPAPSATAAATPTGTPEPTPSPTATPTVAATPTAEPSATP